MGAWDAVQFYAQMVLVVMELLSRPEAAVLSEEVELGVAEVVHLI